MRHKLSGRKLNRSSAHRKALFKNLAADLIKYEQKINLEPINDQSVEVNLGSQDVKGSEIDNVSNDKVKNVEEVEKKEAVGEGNILNTEIINSLYEALKRLKSQNS